MSVRIQTEDFDIKSEVLSVSHDTNAIGAIASFIGVCRDNNEGADVLGMELEHYPGMTERAIEGMVKEAEARFELLGVRVIHRVGPIKLGEQIVLVVAASPHRKAAFEACEFLMDYLKTQAPFWKKERLADGSARWVDARVADDAALARWGIASQNAAP
jgi:molybdopterin synthase catalytic subunit